MQNPTDGPRGIYTRDQVQYLLESTSSFDTTMGLHIVDQSLNFVADVSDALVSASVSRSSYANLHAQLSFAIDAPLQWGVDMVRPYMEITAPTSPTDPIVAMRFYLGVYVVDTPEEDLALDVSSWDATGYDILSLLDDAIGDGYSIDAGEAYLDRVETILQSRGFTQYIIDRDAAASVLPSAKSYTLDDNVTWLTVVNDLLASVGYAGIWSDQNGVLRAQVYRSPSERGPEWRMTDAPATTLLTQRRKRTRDFYDAPNHWVFYQQNNTEAEQASGDNGLRFEFTNASDGETSVEARGGRVITKVVGTDAADALSLQTQAQRTIDADMLIPTLVTIETAPFPLAWHFDRLEISDAQLGASLQVLATTWALNLDGSDMSWEWTSI